MSPNVKHNSPAPVGIREVLLARQKIKNPEPETSKEITHQEPENYPHPKGEDGKFPRVRLRHDRKSAGSIHMLIDPSKRASYMIGYFKADMYEPGRVYTGIIEGGINIDAIRLPGAEIYSVHNRVWTRLGTIEIRVGHSEYVSVRLDQDAPLPPREGDGYKFVATNNLVANEIENATWAQQQRLTQNA